MNLNNLSTTQISYSEQKGSSFFASFWLESYRDGFIEFTQNEDDYECFEIVGIFTTLEAFEVHTHISPDYNNLLLHARTLFDWVIDYPEQRVGHPKQLDSSVRFYFPGSDNCISFTAVRQKCEVPWYPYTEDFPEPLLLVFAPSPEAQAAGWLEAELLPEFN
jgi:hypothetical protein